MDTGVQATFICSHVDVRVYFPAHMRIKYSKVHVGIQFRNEFKT